MTIADQLAVIKARFDAWCARHKGTIELVADGAELTNALRLKPAGVMVYYMFHSETKRGEYEEAGLVDRTFLVVVRRPKSLKVDAGAGLVSGAGGGEALFALADLARQQVRLLVFGVETENRPDFKSMLPFTFPEGTPSDALVIEFSIGTQLAEPTEEVDD